MHRPGTSFKGRNSDMPTDKLSPSGVETDAADSVAVKVERYSPEPDDISPSQSPSSGRASVAESSATDYFSANNLLCGTPVIKQMEMMTRNYSDFMRSLAAKYNNQHAQETVNCAPANGLLRNLDGTFKSAVISPIFNPAMETMDNRKQSPPVLSDLQSLSEFPSSQTLLNLVRTASAHSALQLESYLRGSRKRTNEGDPKFDPLDLSVSPGKQPRTDCIAAPSNPRDLCYVLHNKNEINECTDNMRTKRTPHWLTLLDSRQTDQDISAGNVLVKLANRVRSSSPCSNQSDNELSHWTVEDVVKFVTSIDSCSEYVEKFREQSIDGASLQLLSEEHLTVYLGMKLGPALKLRSAVSRLTGNCTVCMHCIHCHNDLADRASRSPSVSK